MQTTHISCNVFTVMAKFAVGTGLDRLVPKLRLQKLNFWLNLDNKVARQMPMVAVPILKLARLLPCHIQWWRRLWLYLARSSNNSNKSKKLFSYKLQLYG
jgi:hypothetical protein